MKRWSKRGKKTGLLVRLRNRQHRTPLSSILIVNVQSSENKLDELRARITLHTDTKNCNIFVFTETWLDPSVPDSAIVPEEFSIHRRDRTTDSVKMQGRWHVCNDRV